MKIFKEFKEFALRGNVIDLAVGVVIGGAFTAIVNAVVDSLIKPLIASIGGAEVGLAIEIANGQFLDIGAVITAIINFILVALVLFLVIKGINSMNKVTAKLKKQKEEEAAAEEPAPTKEEVLLTEIRDLLKK